MRWNRYKILSASAIPENSTPEKATQIILDQIQLDAEQYRMGKTKVQFLIQKLYKTFRSSMLPKPFVVE